MYGFLMDEWDSASLDPELELGLGDQGANMARIDFSALDDIDVVAYHGTPYSAGVMEGQFYPGSHFGSYKAAQQRMSVVPRGHPNHNLRGFFEVTLHLKKPLFVPDTSADHEISDWRRILCDEMGVLSPDQASYAFDEPDLLPLSRIKNHLAQDCLYQADMIPHVRPGRPYDVLDQARECLKMQRMIQVLERRGYDSFIYSNLLEDKGSLSYVVLRPKDQIVANNFKGVSLFKAPVM